jgi:hypothetical protein
MSLPLRAIDDEFLVDGLRGKNSIDISHNFCGTGILPVLEALFAKCLIEISNNSQVGGGLMRLSIIGNYCW